MTSVGRFEPGDDVGHGEGLAGAGDAEERLVAVPVLDRANQFFDGLGLIPGGLVVGVQFKEHA
jgi:hypothetical protein